MALPPRVFWALEDLAVRWGCAPAEIVGWATEGIIEIVASIGLVQCCGTEPLVGLMVICAEDTDHAVVSAQSLRSQGLHDLAHPAAEQRDLEDHH